jgi:hypothetical protein
MAYNRLLGLKQMVYYSENDYSTWSFRVFKVV